MVGTRALFKSMPSAEERAEELRNLVAEAGGRAGGRFAAMSEDEQMLSLHTQRIGWMWGNDLKGTRSKEEIARKHLLENFGPKFTERVFATPRLRAMLRLE